MHVVHFRRWAGFQSDPQLPPTTKQYHRPTPILWCLQNPGVHTKWNAAWKAHDDVQVRCKPALKCSLVNICEQRLAWPHGLLIIVSPDMPFVHFACAFGSSFHSHQQFIGVMTMFSNATLHWFTPTAIYSSHHQSGLSGRCKDAKHHRQSSWQNGTFTTQSFLGIRFSVGTCAGLQDPIYESGI